MFGLFKKKETAKQDDAAAQTPEASPSDEMPANDVSAAENKVRDNLVFQEEKKREASASRDADDDDGFVPPPNMPAGMVPGGPSGIPGFQYSPVDPDEEFKAVGGQPLDDGVDPAGEEEIVAALQTVYDPEIPVNIYDLGLIYALDIGEKGAIKIDMTLTAPGCPVAGEMPGMVVAAVETVEGAGEVEVSLVWDPPWTPERMSEDAKLALGMG